MYMVGLAEGMYRLRGLARSLHNRKAAISAFAVNTLQASRSLIAHSCGKIKLPSFAFAIILRGCAATCSSQCTKNCNISRQAILVLQSDCPQTLITKSTSPIFDQAELSFHRQPKPKNGKALQLVARPLLSLKPTLYLFHHTLLHPTLSQESDWKVEYEYAQLDTTVEVLRRSARLCETSHHK
jgi:hypothetical protein